jgi:hypothetical protein
MLFPAKCAEVGSNPASLIECGPVLPPPLARKQPDECGEEHPVGRVAAWPAHLPTEHREFVTQDEYLHLVRGV